MPGWTLTNTKLPLALVTVVLEIPVPWLVSVTLAPGSTPPEESVTVPFVSPLDVWAPSGAASASNAASSATGGKADCNI